MERKNPNLERISIGDHVCLYSEESRGYAFSYQTSGAHTEIGVAVDQDRDLPSIPNIQAAVFEICTQNRYKFNKELPSIRAELKKSPGDVFLQSQFNKIKNDADLENEENALEQRRQAGKRLLYGQIIQLRHKYTQKYIHVNATQTSWTEPSNMLVELRGNNAKTALFKVMPRYKVKSEGDFVQVDDQIVLESLKSPGQFLRVSREEFGIRMVYTNSRELNLSVRPSGFTIYRHFSPEAITKPKGTAKKPSPPQVPQNKLRGGSFVRLYHRELEAYLVAEGLQDMTRFDNVYAQNYAEGKFASELQEDFIHLHFRVRPINQANPKTMYPSTSAVTYWQVEKERSLIDGSALLWEEQCRLRHVTTRQFLSVDEDGNVGLTSDHLNPRTVFRIHPVVKDSDAVLFESFVRLEHVVSGFWLHADSTKTYETKLENGTGDCLQSLSWTTAKLKEVTALEEMMYDDAFSLQRVDEQLVLDANYVAGMVPFTHKLVYDALQELKDFCMSRGFYEKAHQKLLRNFMVVDIIVELLKYSTKELEDSSLLTSVFSDCYRLLYSYLRGNSRKNELYMARHLEFFMDQLSLEGAIGLNAALMVMELVGNNRKMVDRIKKSHIEQFCSLLKKTRNYRYLDLLGVLCMCDGIALVENQNFILDTYLVKSASKIRDCLFHTELGQKVGGKRDIVYVSVDSKKTWRPLHEFASKSFLHLGDLLKPSTAEDLEGSGSETTDAEMYLFLELQLKLYSKICYGRNDHAVDVITEELQLISWEVIFAAMRDDRIPDQLRAVFCTLIMDLYIDRGGNFSVLDRLNLVFVYPDVPLPGQINDEGNKSILSDSVPLPFIKDLKAWMRTFLDQNQCMIASLVGKNKFTEEVLALTFNLVNFGYFGDIKEVQNLLRALMILLDGRNDLPCPLEDQGEEIQLLITTYRSKRRFEPNAQTTAIVNAKYQALKIVSLFFNLRFNTRLMRFISEFKFTLTQEQTRADTSPELAPFLYSEFDFANSNQDTKTMLKKMELIFSETDYFATSFNDTLLDLCSYKYDTLVTQAMSLLDRYHSAYEILLTRAVQTRLLLTERSCFALRRVKDNLPLLKLLGTNLRMNEENAQKLIGILDEFIELCSLEEDEEEPHPENQRILYNHGVVADIFDILSRKIDATLVEQYSNMRNVFVKCFILLRVMSKNNPVVQERLFGRLNTLLRIKGATDELAFLFVEIFNGNKSVCLRILPRHINSIVELLASNGNPVILRLLSSLIQIGELPLKRNQTLVMKALLQNRESVQCVIDTTAEERLQIMMAEEGGEEDEDTNLLLKRYFCNIVQLLAFCSSGENRTVESICQCMFTVEELLNLATQPVCGGLRKGFVQFLTNVFLNSSSDLATTDLKDFSHHPKLWALFSQLGNDMQEATNFVQSNEEEGRSLLKAKPQRIHAGVGDTTHEMKELLHFLFDSAFPFLNGFLKTFYRPDSFKPQSRPQLPRLDDDDGLNSSLVRSQMEKRTLEGLVVVMRDFSTAVHPCLTDGVYLKTLLTSFRQLLHATKSVLEIPPQLLEGLPECGKEARKLNQAYYKTENELNSQLDMFAANVRLAYGGKNSVTDQLGFPADTAYMEENGEEELPLGSEFQDMVTWFVDKNIDPSEAGTPLQRRAMGKRKYAKAMKLTHQLRNSRKFIGKLSERDKLEQEALDVKCLQVLRALIHNEIVKLPQSRTSSNKKHYDRQVEVIKVVQCALIDMNVIASALPHLNHPGDVIPREVLALLCALLHAGHPEVQESFVRFFVGTKEETFFYCIQNRIQRSISMLKERRALTARHENLLKEHQKSIRALLKRRGSEKSILSKASKQTSILDEAGSITKKTFSKLGSVLGVKNSSRQGTGVNRVKPQPEPPKIEVEMEPFDNPPAPGEPNTSEGNFDDECPLVETETDPIDQPMRNSTLQIPEKVVVASKVDTNRLKAAFAGEMGEILEEYKDTGYISMILKILAQMCDGQNKLTQDYLREQKDNIKSINLVSECARLLQLVYANTNFQSIALVTQLVDTLTEFAQGNHENQMVLFDQKCVDYCNIILRKSEFPGCDLCEIFELKKSIGTLIEAVTEENTVSGHTKVIMDTVTVEEIHKTMVESHRMLLEDYAALSHEERDLIEFVGFLYCHILCRKFDMEPLLSREQYTQTPAWHFFINSTLSVEIVKEDVLQRIYFKVRDKKVLRNWVKEKLKWEIDRTSPTNKLQGFLSWCHDIRKDISYQRKVNSFTPARILVRGWKFLNIACLILTFMINIGILSFWTAPEMNDPSYKYSLKDGRWLPTYPQEFDKTVFALGILHNVLSVLLLVGYLLAQKPSFPELPWQKRKRKKEQLKKKRISHLEVKFFSFKTFYYILYVGLSFTASTVSHSIFAFHLFHIAANNQLLSRVIKAVTLNGRSLLWVGFLGIVIIYVYALVGFAFLRDIFHDNSLFCRSMWECFLTLIREGLLYGLTEWQIENDMKTTCFICSKTTYEFEHHGKGFRQHVEDEHSMWSYIFFFIYLDDTTRNDLSALELYVFRLLRIDDCSFFPLNRALALLQWEELNTDTRLEMLLEQVNVLVQRMQEEDAQKAREAERRRQLEWWEEIKNIQPGRKYSIHRSGSMPDQRNITWQHLKSVLKKKQGGTSPASRPANHQEPMKLKVNEVPKETIPKPEPPKRTGTATFRPSGNSKSAKGNRKMARSQSEVLFEPETSTEGTSISPPNRNQKDFAMPNIPSPSTPARKTNSDQP